MDYNTGEAKQRVYTTDPGPELPDMAVADTEWRLRHAFETLTAAAILRRDDKLMADLRVWLRKQRDDLGALLDDIGV